MKNVIIIAVLLSASATLASAQTTAAINGGATVPVIVSPATTTVLGAVQPDGTTILVNASGVVSIGTVSSATTAVNLSGSQTANFVYASPTGVSGVASFRALLAADVPILNQNTTGTAANITATSNSTITALTALSLPGSQVSGTVALATSATNVSGTVAIANGGTGANTAAAALTALGGVTSASPTFTGAVTATQVRSGTASNSDFDGELSFTAAKTATYTLVGTYVSHPEVTLTPQFNTNGNAPWVTYTGVTSFTINFASVATGAVTYTIGGRN